MAIAKPKPRPRTGAFVAGAPEEKLPLAAQYANAAHVLHCSGAAGAGRRDRLAQIREPVSPAEPCGSASASARSAEGHLMARGGISLERSWPRCRKPQRDG
jgi:hypothetical protein